MATIELHQLSLIELAKRSLHADELLPIVELMVKRNRWLEDATWVESNKTTSHLFPIRTHEPTGSPRELNKGIPVEASGVSQLEEPLMMLEGESVIDERWLQLSRNRLKARSDEDKSFISGMGKTVAEILVYGNRADDPRIITGWAPRMNDESDDYVIDAEGTTNLTSLYLVQWGEQYCSMIYPQGSETMGIRSEDMMRNRVLDSDSNPYWAWITRFYYDFGFMRQNPRCLIRIANIDTQAATLPDIDNMLIDAMHESENDAENMVIYGNRDVMKIFDKKAKDKSNVNYDQDTVWGRVQTYFRTAPLKLMETISSNETRVV